MLLLQAAEQYQDNIFYPFFTERIAPVLEENPPDYIGISLAYLDQALPAFALIAFIEARFPGCKIILGGGLISSWLRSPLWKTKKMHLFNGMVEACIAGSGEQVLLEMLSGGTKQGKTAPPEYDSIDYLGPGFILPYAASQGCYWNKCSFCPEPAENNPYIPLPPEQVLLELQVLLARQQTLLIHFLDNAISPALMKALVNNPPGVPWYGFARVSSLLADKDFCRALRRSGCLMLKLGLESGDQEVLNQMHKGIELSMVRQVLQALKAAGILSYVYLLFGTPAEDEDSAFRTMEFTARHHDEISFLNLAVFNLPLAGPETSVLHLNAFYSGDLSLYTDFVHPLGWSRRKVRSFLDKQFRRHQAIRPILQRDPPFFTSNHAPLFHPFFD